MAGEGLEVAMKIVKVTGTGREGEGVTGEARVGVAQGVAISGVLRHLRRKRRRMNGSSRMGQVLHPPSRASFTLFS